MKRRQDNKEESHVEQKLKQATDEESDEEIHAEAGAEEENSQDELIPSILGMDWKASFFMLYRSKPPTGSENLTLSEAVASRKKFAVLDDFFASCLYQDPITAQPVLVSTPADIAAAVGPAVAAAVGPAVAAAVGPAVTTAVGPAVTAAIAPVAAAIAPVAAAIAPMAAAIARVRIRFVVLCIYPPRLKRRWRTFVSLTETKSVLRLVELEFFILC
jgi:hypothetical protein